MKRIVLGLIVSVVAGSGFAECSYNMNGSINSPEYQPFPSVVLQKANYSWIPITTQINYFAKNPSFNENSTTPTGYINLPTNGVFAFELKTKGIAEELQGNERSLQGYTITGFGPTDKVSFSLFLGYSNNTAVQNFKRSLIVLSSNIVDGEEATLAGLYHKQSPSTQYHRLGV